MISTTPIPPTLPTPLARHTWRSGVSATAYATPSYILLVSSLDPHFAVSLDYLTYTLFERYIAGSTTEPPSLLFHEASPPTLLFLTTGTPPSLSTTSTHCLYCNAPFSTSPHEPVQFCCLSCYDNYRSTALSTPPAIPSSTL